MENAGVNAAAPKRGREEEGVREAAGKKARVAGAEEEEDEYEEVALPVRSGLDSEAPPKTTTAPRVVVDLTADDDGDEDSVGDCSEDEEGGTCDQCGEDFDECECTCCQGSNCDCPPGDDRLHHEEYCNMCDHAPCMCDTDACRYCDGYWTEMDCSCQCSCGA